MRWVDIIAQRSDLRDRRSYTLRVIEYTNHKVSAEFSVYVIPAVGSLRLLMVGGVDNKGIDNSGI